MYDIGLGELRNIGVALMNADECIVWIVDSSSKTNNNNQLPQKLKIN